MTSEKQRAREGREGEKAPTPESPLAAGACPRCGNASEGALECPRCGVLLAKARARAEVLAVPLQMQEEPAEPRDWRRTALAGLGLVAAVWAGTGLLAPPPDSPPKAVVRVAPPTTIEAVPSPPTDVPAEGNPALAEPSPEPVDMSVAPDEAPVTEPGVVPGPGEPLPTAPRPLAAPDPNLVNLRQRMAAGDWSGAEDSAIAVLKTTPRLPEAMCGLGKALFRQDRSREAIEAIKECAQYSVTASDRQTAQNLLRQVEGSLAPEGGLEELRSARFHVRFDGEAHEDIGRAVLRTLDRQYDTVASALSHRPAGVIPVTLYSNLAYVAATGSSDSLGMYSHGDGRIRINIRGVPAGLTSEIESTLIHELTHAFARDMSRGLVPRDVNEGLAQYMEGERVGNRLPPELASALSSGGVRNTGDFYTAALSFVEHLIGLRGMSGMRDLLVAMGEKRNANRGFEDVYGKSYSELRKAWLAQIRPS